MENNSFSFMKEGFDWQSEQSNDMEEIANEGVRAFINDRHDSDEEELRRESEELRDYNNFFDLEDR